MVRASDRSWFNSRQGLEGTHQSYNVFSSPSCQHETMWRRMRSSYRKERERTNSFFSLMPKVERTTSPKPKEEFTGMMGNLARALDERHKVMHSSGEYNHS